MNLNDAFQQAKKEHDCYMKYLQKYSKPSDWYDLHEIVHRDGKLKQRHVNYFCWEDVGSGRYKDTELSGHKGILNRLNVLQDFIEGYRRYF
jgi:hypothetical protein